VHTRIDLAELPVLHQTRRQGRPYTLVLTKTQELFTREQTVRRQAAEDLAWLMLLRNRRPRPPGRWPRRADTPRP
jgi:hypothetical protein